MGYDRNGRDDGRGGNEGDFGRREYGRGNDQGRPFGYSSHGNDDRGFLDRAGDEVRSWFGDDEAERRRRMDERADERGRYEAGSRGVGSNRGSGPDGGYRAERGTDRDRAYQGRSSWDRTPDAGERAGRGSSPSYGQSGSSFGNEHPHDTHYRSWRDRQMESFDRDYADYRRENQSRFESEFGNWRTQREGQRSQLRQVTEHQEVVGSDGEHVGTVDHVQGDQIKLARKDVDAAGRHHFVPLAWIQSVTDKVTLRKTAAEAKQHWTDEARSAGSSMFGRTDQGAGDRDRPDATGEDGSPNLNRSFSGTY